MATKQVEIGLLKGKIKELNGLDLELVVNTPTGEDDYSFEKAVPFFKEIITLYNTIGIDELPFFHIDVITRLKNLAKGTLDAYSSIVEQYHPGDDRDANIEKIESLISGAFYQYHDTYKEFIPFIALEESPVSTSSGVLNKLESAVQQSEEKLKRIDWALIETERLLEPIRDNSGAIAISRHGEYFKGEADEHEESAKKWLKAVFGISALGVVVVILFIWALPFLSPSIKSWLGIVETQPASSEKVVSATGNTETGSKQKAASPVSNIVSNSIGKVFLFSIIYYMLVWAARNYRAHRHNAVMNRHRALSISTFESFTALASDYDPDIKAAVLLKTTEAIFGPSATGYLSGEKEQTQGNPVIGSVQTLLKTKPD